jgi:transcriptional regulator with XRE-family HTH domain
MNALDLKFFGTRLKLARKMAGMSLQDLSDVVKNIVTKQALNKYEQGLMNPSNEVLLNLSKALKVKPDFFLKQTILELGLISFRKTSSLTKMEEDSIIEKVRFYIERFTEIETLLDLDQHFDNPLDDLIINTKEDVEHAANKLRETWELGNTQIMPRTCKWFLVAIFLRALSAVRMIPLILVDSSRTEQSVKLKPVCCSSKI